jgi:hypothetical protein
MIVSSRFALASPPPLGSAVRCHYVRTGIEVLEDIPGSGEVVRRHEWYHVRRKMWLSRGDLLHRKVLLLHGKFLPALRAYPSEKLSFKLG